MAILDYLNNARANYDRLQEELKKRSLLAQLGRSASAIIPDPVEQKIGKALSPIFSGAKESARQAAVNTASSLPLIGPTFKAADTYRKLPVPARADIGQNVGATAKLAGAVGKGVLSGVGNFGATQMDRVFGFNGQKLLDFGSIAKDVGAIPRDFLVRPTYRAATGFATSGISRLAGLQTPESIPAPTSKLGQFFLGTDPIKSVRGVEASAPQTAELLGYSPKFARNVAPFLGVGLMASDLIPFSPKKAAGKVAADVVGEAAEKAAKEAAQYAAEQTAKRAAAEVAGSPNLLQRIRNFGNVARQGLADATIPLTDPLMSYERKTGAKILPEKDVRLQIDRVLRADTLANQFIKDSGIEKIIQDVPDLDEFDQYLIARQSADVEKQGIKTGRDAARDANLVQVLGPKYEQYAQQVTQYSHGILDYITQNGLISKEAADALKVKFPNYVPLNRVFSEVEQAIGEGVGKTTRGVANLGKQTVVQKLQGSAREIANPLQSLLEKTYDAFRQGERNKAAQMLGDYANLEGNPLGLRQLRSADDVTERIGIFGQLKDYRKVQDAMENVVSRHAKQIRSIQSELRKLNVRGVKESLNKLSSKIAPESPLASVTIKRTAEYVKENAPKTFDQLTNSYYVKGDLQKEFATFDRLVNEVKEGGWQRLVDIGVNESTAEAIAKQIFKEPTRFPATATASQTFATLADGDVKKFVESLISLPKGSVEKLKQMIGSREGKVSTLFDDLATLENEIDYVKQRRGDLRGRARDLADDVGDSDKGTFTFLRNGVKEIYEAPPEIAAAARSLKVQQMDTLLRVLAVPNRIFKVGTSGLNVPFTAANAVKDLWTSINLSPSALNTVLNPIVFLKGLTSALKHDELFDAAMRDAALMTSFDIARNQANQTLKGIRAGRSVGSKILYTVTRPSELLRAVEDVIGRSEEFSRLIQYEGINKKMLREGASPERARLLAADAARNTTANFPRRGTWGNLLGAILPYFNSSVQGSRSFIRAMKERPARTSAMIATSLFMPVAAATAWNLSDEKRRKVYLGDPSIPGSGIEDFEKENNIILIPPNPTQDDRGRWNIIKIPMPAGLSSLTIPIRKALEGFAGSDPVAFGDIVQGLLGAVSPINLDVSSDAPVLEKASRAISNIVPQAIKPTVEAVTNTNMFTGRKQVPPSMENLPPELQVRDYTSGLARLFGGAVGASPIKVEEFVKGTFGQVGSQALNLADSALAGAGVIPKEQIGGESIKENFIRRFGKAYGGTQESNAYEQVQKYMDREDRASADLKTKAQQLDAQLSTLPPEEASAKFNEIKSSDPKLAEKLKDVVEERKLGLTSAEKAIKGLTVEMRAQYIYDQLQKLGSDGERAAFWEDYKNKKIISDNVSKRLLELLGK